MEEDIIWLVVGASFAVERNAGKGGLLEELVLTSARRSLFDKKNAITNAIRV